MADRHARPSRAVALLVAALLAGCSTVPREPLPADAPPAQWHAELPHGGQPGELARWWQQFDDPLLAELVQAAQQASPDVAAAGSRIAQARAARVAAGAALAPGVDATASAVRGRQDFFTPQGWQASAGLQARWELDLFGGNRAARDAAEARLAGADAGWHDARVAVAAETGNTYVGLRACEAQLVTTETDAASRGETARLTALATQAGFQAPATEALARASAAQARSQLAAQRAQCERSLKALVALTALDEPALRTRLAATTARVPQPAGLTVDTVPGAVLAQRPDVYAAAREVEAASADVGQARAQRLPRVTLSGSLSAARFDAAGLSGSGTLWSIGPLAVALPVFDAGARRANVESARARHDAAVARYAATLRGAVREVEDALVRLAATAGQEADARIAVEGYQASYLATESRYRGGLASLFELEDVRRSTLLAQSQLIDLQRERVTAWVALYRALGGGWSAPDASPGPADRPTSGAPAAPAASPAVSPAASSAASPAASPAASLAALPAASSAASPAAPTAASTAAATATAVRSPASPGPAPSRPAAPRPPVRPPAGAATPETR